MMRVLRPSFLVCLVLCLTAGGAAAAVDPVADRVVREMASRFLGLQSFTVTVESWKRSSFGKTVQNERTRQSVAFSKPNRIAITFHEGGRLEGSEITSDGATVCRSSAGRSQTYECRQESFDPKWLHGDNPIDCSGIGGDFLKALFSPTFVDRLFESADSVRSLGVERTGSRDLHRIAITQGMGTMELWIGIGAAPPLVRTLFTVLWPDGSGKVTMEVLFEDWSVNVPVPDPAFAFKVPEGYARGGSQTGPAGSSAPAAPKPSVAGATPSDGETGAPGQGVPFSSGGSPRALPSDPKAKTEKDYRSVVAGFYRRSLAEAYERKHGPKVTSEAVFLRRFADTFDDAVFTWAPADLAAEAEAIAASGTKDPLVLFACAASIEGRGRLEEARGLYRQSHAEFDEQGVKSEAIHAACLTRYVWTRLRTGEDEARIVSDAMRHLGKAVELREFRGEERRIPVRWVLAWSPAVFDGGDVMPLIHSIYPERGDDPWVVAVLSGFNHINEAWQSRGGGFASEVKEEGWKGFREQLREAQKDLVAAWTMRPDHPEAPALMITVAMGGCDGQVGTERLWFDRAVAAQFDFEEAYMSYAFSIMPRWGGSHERMFAFAKECLASGRFDTRVPYFFFEILHRINRDLDGSPSWAKRPDVAPLMRTALGTVPPDARGGATEATYASLLAAWSWYAGYHDEADALFRRLGDRVDSREIRIYFREDAARIAGESALRVGPAGAAAARAEEMAQRGDCEGAASVYEEILGHEPEGMASGYAAARLRELRQQAAFARSEWVDMVPASGLEGWRVDRGTWDRAPDGSLRGSTDERGAVLIGRLDPGLRFELVGQSGTSTPYSASLNVGIRYLEDWVYLNWFQSRLKGGTEFRILVWDNRALLDAYGKTIPFVSDTSPDIDREPKRITLGTKTEIRGATVSCWSLRVRRLSERPAELGP